VRALGGELSAAWGWRLPFATRLQSGLTYTFTDARNRSNPVSAAYDKPLRYVPWNQANVHSTLSWGPVALTGHARYTGRRYVTSDGSQSLAPYVVAGSQLSVAYEIRDVRAELSLEIDNLLDTDYESVGGRPMPPRHAQLRLHLAY
jgi:outer membrane cobalamin receptor